jgi:hypothetical protein
MSIKILRRPIKELIADCGLFHYPLWLKTDRPMISSDIHWALRTNFYLAPNDTRDPNLYMSAQSHAARVAWLIKFVDLAKVTITIADKKIVDGNHRIAACIYSEMEHINCVHLGSV